MKKCIVFILLINLGLLIKADPPKPPLGKRWVINHDFSDEFNGTQLDSAKWWDHHPTWRGRVPGLFMPSQVSVKDGYMQIRGEKLEKDTIVHGSTFTIAGGAVRSKNTVYSGYFECRVKAAATTMSTTFWFSGGGGEGPNGCDRYGQEWDIQECIGREGDFKGKYFASGMHSNAHYWYTDCDGKRFDHRAAQVIFEDTELASEDFHVYGGWWRDEISASYYYDNGEPKHQKFYDKVSKKPMDKPMHMNLVCETYPFPWIELPNDEELADTSKNTVYYDWVRSYKLVDVDDPNPLNPDEVIEIYNENVTFPTATIEEAASNVLQIPFTYKANEDREINLKFFDPSGNEVAETIFPAYAGYANVLLDFEVVDELEALSGYTVVAVLHPVNNNSFTIYSNTLILNLSE